MKERIIICVFAALIGAVIKLICEAADRNKTSDIINTLVGGFILLSLFPLTAQNISAPTLPSDGFSADYEAANKEIVEQIYLSAETEIANLISQEVYCKFGISPIKCDILISNDELTIEKAELIFSNEEKLISSYEIKSYLKEKYEMDVEVIVI